MVSSKKKGKGNDSSVVKCTKLSTQPLIEATMKSEEILPPGIAIYELEFGNVWLMYWFLEFKKESNNKQQLFKHRHVTVLTAKSLTEKYYTMYNNKRLEILLKRCYLTAEDIVDVNNKWWLLLEKMLFCHFICLTGSSTFSVAGAGLNDYSSTMVGATTGQVQGIRSASRCACKLS